MLPNSVAVWIRTHEPLVWVLYKTPEGSIADNLYYVVYPTPDDPPSEHYGPYRAMCSEPTMSGVMLPNRIDVWEYHDLPLLWVMEETPDGEFIEHLYYVVYPTPDNPPGFHYGPYGTSVTEPIVFSCPRFFVSHVVYPSPSPTP